ncbi:unnamed protein product, partial [Oppiella nova]
MKSLIIIGTVLATTCLSSGHQTNPMFEPFGDLLQGKLLSAGSIRLNFSLISLKASLDDKQNLENSFQEFKTNFNKSYETVREDKEREQIFKKNMLQVFEHNVDALNGKSSYTEHINRFADMTAKEIIGQFTGFRLPSDSNVNQLAVNTTNRPQPTVRPRISFVKSSNTSAGSGVKIGGIESQNSWIYDWRSVGVIGPVQNQGSCGSCTLFTAAALVESYWARYGHGVIPLSPQQLLDCSS